MAWGSRNLFNWLGLSPFTLTPSLAVVYEDLADEVTIHQYTRDQVLDFRHLLNNEWQLRKERFTSNLVPWTAPGQLVHIDGRPLSPEELRKLEAHDEMLRLLQVAQEPPYDGVAMLKALNAVHELFLDDEFWQVFAKLCAPAGTVEQRWAYAGMSHDCYDVVLEPLIWPIETEYLEDSENRAMVQAIRDSDLFPKDRDRLADWFTMYRREEATDAVEELQVEVSVLALAAQHDLLTADTFNNVLVLLRRQWLPIMKSPSYVDPERINGREAKKVAESLQRLGQMAFERFWDATASLGILLEALEFSHHHQLTIQLNDQVQQMRCTQALQAACQLYAEGNLSSCLAYLEFALNLASSAENREVIQQPIAQLRREVRHSRSTESLALIAERREFVQSQLQALTDNVLSEDGPGHLVLPGFDPFTRAPFLNGDHGRRGFRQLIPLRAVLVGGLSLFYVVGAMGGTVLWNHFRPVSTEAEASVPTLAAGQSDANTTGAPETSIPTVAPTDDNTHAVPDHPVETTTAIPPEISAQTDDRERSFTFDHPAERWRLPDGVSATSGTGTLTISVNSAAEHPTDIAIPLFDPDAEFDEHQVTMRVSRSIGEGRIAVYLRIPGTEDSWIFLIDEHQQVWSLDRISDLSKGRPFQWVVPRSYTGYNIGEIATVKVSLEHGMPFLWLNGIVVSRGTPLPDITGDVHFEVGARIWGRYSLSLSDVTVEATP